ncbi:MAG: hypothetical protein ABIX46_13275 [Burkholderiaceae bacterium]
MKLTLVAGSTLVLNERSGHVIRLALDEKFSVDEVVPIEANAIKSGSYIGTAARSWPDGTLRAIEVLVFPEPARGSGEGHPPWDLEPGSTLTHASVAERAAAPQGGTLTLRHKDGEKTVIVPDDVPIVTVKPGDKALLVPGAKVLVMATQRDGKPVALRAIAGREGFAPPM